MLRPLVSSLISLAILSPPLVTAAPMGAEEAAAVASAWLAGGQERLGSRFESEGCLDATIKFTGEKPYYVVSLGDTGFVVVSKDDALEPILAFSATGRFNPSEESPLAAMLEADVAGRLAAAAAGPKEGSLCSLLGARSKWEYLLGRRDADPGTLLQEKSDLRVAPLIGSRWGQLTEADKGRSTYNYYTPDHTLSGGAATSLAQLLRHFRYPASALGTRAFLIQISKGLLWSRMEPLMGGDGKGGPYEWSLMPREPASGVTDEERRMIDRLTHDTGAALHTRYGRSDVFNGSVRVALKQVFKFAQAYDFISAGERLALSPELLNTNLDAGYPLQLVTRSVKSESSYSMLCDGYGYDGGTLYHHLNMGRAGMDDLWYALPAGVSGDSSIGGVTFNAFPERSGEIISGRVIDGGGNGVEGVTLTLEGGNAEPESTVTRAYGVYAFSGVKPRTAYKVGVRGATSYSRAVTTGESADSHEVPRHGNVWKVDFETEAVPELVSLTIQEPIGGVLYPPPGDQSVKTGKPIAIHAAALPGYHFAGWTVEGAASLADATSEKTEAVLSGSAAIGAMFRDAGLAPVSISAGVFPESAGAAHVSIERALPGESTTFEAWARHGWTFACWSADGYVTPVDACNEQTAAYIRGTGALTARFARNSTVPYFNARLSNETEGSDWVEIRRATHELSAFNPAKDKVHVVVGDKEFIPKPGALGRGRWKKTGKTFSYQTLAADSPPHFTLALDLQSKRWTFKARRADISSAIHEPLFVGLITGAYEQFSKQYRASELRTTAAWHFDAATDRLERLTPPNGASPLALSVRNANGRLESGKTTRGRFTIPRCKLSPFSFGDVRVRVGDFSRLLPASRFKGIRRKVYKDPAAARPRLSLAFDLTRHSFSLKVDRLSSSFMSRDFGEVHFGLHVGRSAGEVLLKGRATGTLSSRKGPGS